MTLLKVLLASVLMVAAGSSAALAQKTGEASVVAFTGHVLEPAKAQLPDLSQLKVPDGFKVSVFAKDLINPRMMAVADDGTIYVTRRSVGDVVMLRDADADGSAEIRKVVANRPQMHGIAIDGDAVYLVTVNDVYRSKIKPDGTFETLERIIDDLPDSGQHPNRTLQVGPDKMLYISVGSTCNACTESSPESATILRASSDGTKRAVFASGLRNTIGFGWHPATGTMIGADHNIDWHGDDQPPEEINVLRQGGAYGWPYVLADGFLNPQDDPPGDVTLEELAAASEKPALTYTAHAAPMQMTFYDHTRFPADFRGDAFIAMRGSWNRNPPSGYEVLRLRFKDGKASKLEPFLTGFLKKSGENYTRFGRPAGIVTAKDGSILVSDDENGVIYRIAYEGSAEPASQPSEQQAGTTKREEKPIALPLAADVVGVQTKLEVSSSVFAEGAEIPLRYADYGEKISPPLQWSAGPSKTKSYAVIVDDPDAKPNVVNHWTVFNIPADATSLAEGVPGVMSLELPKDARQGKTTRGSVGYFGPRPPAGDPPHRYHFQVFALNKMLELEPGADKASLLEAMKGHVLAAGVMVGTFGRPADVQKTVDAARGLKRQ